MYGGGYGRSQVVLLSRIRREADIGCTLSDCFNAFMRTNGRRLYSWRLPPYVLVLTPFVSKCRSENPVPQCSSSFLQYRAWGRGARFCCSNGVEQSWHDGAGGVFHATTVPSVVCSEAVANRMNREVLNHLPTSDDVLTGMLEVTWSSVEVVTSSEFAIATVQKHASH